MQTTTSIFSNIATKYDFLNDLLSFGLHRLWRKWALKHTMIQPSAKVLDLCTGTGDFALALYKTRPDLDKIVGVDSVSEMLRVAQTKISLKNATNAISLIQSDASNLPFDDNSFDNVIVAFGLRNAKPLAKVLQEVRRVLSKNGALLVLEFGENHSKNLIARSASFYIASILPTLGRLLSGNKNAYSYLSSSCLSFPSGKDFVRILEDAGFGEIRHKTFCCGVVYIYTAHN